MTPGAAAPRRLRFDTPLGRLLLLGILMLVLMIPLGMIETVVQERQQRQLSAQAEVTAKWGGAQTFLGPVLRVPYVLRRPASAAGQSPELRQETAYFLPRSLDIETQAGVELRRRGIFGIPVYAVRLKASGHFDPPDFSGWDVRPADILWSRAELMIGLTEPRALRADARLHWNGSLLRLQPSSGRAGNWHAPGVHARLGTTPPIGPQGVPFHLELGYNGAASLRFAPAAEDSRVRLQGNWPHPSFQGGWLPQQSRIGAEGFEAQWAISFLGRGYPQRWRDSDDLAAAVNKAEFGVDLATPGDHYSRALRVTKYAVMTLVFTFAVLWLTEMLSHARLHPVQYALTGMALCLFGLLQLSFAEHFGFGPAFAVAAAAVIGLVTLYSRSSLRSLARALAVGGVLCALYGYLYMILQAEDYALLGGSLALFAGLTAAMYLTRRIDWFALSQREP